MGYFLLNGIPTLPQYITDAGAIASLEDIGIPVLNASGIHPDSIVSLESFGTPQLNQNIFPDSILTAESFGSLELGNEVVVIGGVKRFYLPSTGLPAISPTHDSGWEVSRLMAIKLKTTPINSDMIVRSATDANTTSRDVLIMQYISDPIPAQTILAQTIKLQCMCSESSDLNNMLLTVGLRVVSSDGLTVRGTLLSVTRDDVEAGTSYTNRRFTATTTEVVTQDSDRLCIEIGMGGIPDTGGSHTFSMVFGDNASVDLPEDDTDLNFYNPWIEFENAINFSAVSVPLIIYAYRIPSAESFGIPTLTMTINPASITTGEAFGSPAIRSYTDEPFEKSKQVIQNWEPIKQEVGSQYLIDETIWDLALTVWDSDMTHWDAITEFTDTMEKNFPASVFTTQSKQSSTVFNKNKQGATSFTKIKEK